MVSILQVASSHLMTVHRLPQSGCAGCTLQLSAETSLQLLPPSLQDLMGLLGRWETTETSPWLLSPVPAPDSAPAKKLIFLPP